MSVDQHGVGASRIGLIGLGVMGQNLALNIAEKGFPISVFNRTYTKTIEAVELAVAQKLDHNLKGYEHIHDFVQSLQKPRAIIMLVTAGKAVDATIELLKSILEKDDIIIDGGNEWYQNSERRAAELIAAPYHIHYMGMGVSGGDTGARNGPSIMPACVGSFAYDTVEPILKKIAAQVASGPCVTLLSTASAGAGNYIKMIHNGIEYGDMQLIAEAYDILSNSSGLLQLTVAEVQATFEHWDSGDLKSYLIEITAQIFKKKHSDKENDYLINYVLDKTGNKGTGKWTVQTAAEHSVAVPTMAAALDARFISSMKADRQAAAAKLVGPTLPAAATTTAAEKQALIDDIGRALYAAKICSYAQGMNLIQTAGNSHNWGLNLSAIASLWQGGCIIRAPFLLTAISTAFAKNPLLLNLLLDDVFVRIMQENLPSLRRVVVSCIERGIAAPAFSNSIAYYDSYRRATLPANLTQAQRDFFGAHTYERVDKPAGQWFHSEWANPQPDASA